MEPTKYFTEAQIKEKRVEIDAIMQFVSKEQELGTQGITNKDERLYDMAIYQTIVHLKNAKMWLGVMLEGRGTPFPVELADKAKRPDGEE